MQIELNYPDPVPLELDASKTLLLIVDMENEDAHPSGKRFGGEAVTSIIPNIASSATQGTPSRRIRGSHSIGTQTGGAGIYLVQ